jgi:hypothetical protein
MVELEPGSPISLTAFEFWCRGLVEAVMGDDRREDTSVTPQLEPSEPSTEARDYAVSGRPMSIGWLWFHST